MTYRGVVVDLDGTVLRGDDLIPGASEGLRAIRAHAECVLFLTNNPTRTPEAYAARLRDLGVEASADEVLTSGAATVAYLRAHHAGDRVFPIAEESVTAQFRDAGLSLVDDPTAAECVVVGYDREFSYGDMVDALRALDDGGVALVGTDPDVTVPTPDGPVPGSGAILAAVTGVTGRDPDAVLGKPSTETAEFALDRLGVPAADCLLVGDRLDTDVAMGEAVGATTALVRTGVTDDEALAASDVAPDHVVDSLRDVAEILDG